MAAPSMEQFRFLVERAGLRIAQEEMEEVKDLFDRFEERMEVLRSIDLADEEVAGTFSAAWTLDK